MYNTAMISPRLRRILGILILLISLALLCWGIWPLEELSRSVPIAPTEMQLPTPVGALNAIWIL
jgi:hypothetical protein